MEGRMRIKIKYDKEVKMFVAHDPDLKVWTQGETRYKAKKNLEDAVAGFLFVAYKHGELKRILKETPDAK